MRTFHAMRRRFSTVLLALAAVLSVGTCGTGTEEAGRTGVLRFVQVEGGCWELETDEESFEVLNLEEDFPAFAEDGLRVRFEGEIRDDVTTICQLGPNLELTALERAE